MLTKIIYLKNQAKFSGYKAAVASRCCKDGICFSICACPLRRLFLNYDLMLTKIRNPENQDFLSCHTAAVVAEPRGSGGGGGGNFI